MHALFRLVSIALALLAGHAALAQAPRPPLRVIVGFAPGGPPDLVARRIAARLSDQTGRSVVVENRPGASGTLAASAVAQAPADGNTLLFGVAANLAVAPANLRSPPYDPVRDFTPIVEVARGAYVLLVRADAPPDFGQFVQSVRQSPGRFNFGTPGPGSAHHLAFEVLKGRLGLDMVHVPYRTGLYPPLLAGDIQVILESLPSPLAHVQSGRLRALAVTGPRRLARLPDVPTFAELGVAEMADIGSWWGFAGPAALPRPVVERLNAELRQAMGDPELAATLDGWGITPSPGTPEAFGRLIAEENRRWRAKVQQLGLPLE
jgi:tripartite-type tricarboxylate transporter receptor subunit TctC